jgi:hypothetical protein
VIAAFRIDDLDVEVVDAELRREPVPGIEQHRISRVRAHQNDAFRRRSSGRRERETHERSPDGHGQSHRSVRANELSGGGGVDTVGVLAKVFFGDAHASGGAHCRGRRAHSRR